MKNLNSFQILLTRYTIERKFDLDPWKGKWYKTNNSTYGNRQVQAILTRWEHVAKASKKSFDKIASSESHNLS